MRPTIAIFIFWILAGKLTESETQDCARRICSLNPSSFTSISREIRVQIEPTQCHDLSSTSPGRAEVRLNLNCVYSNDRICTGMLGILWTCPTFTQIQSDSNPPVDSICQHCPNTTIDCPIITSGPPTPNTDCPTWPSDVPTSITPTPTNETITDPSPQISPTITSGPSTPNTNCPMWPSSVPTSSMPTFKNETIIIDPSARISKVVHERDSLKVLVTALGVLVGILVVLLAVVTSGWVWTCWTMKRNNLKATTPEHVRTTQNTAYGVIGPVGNSAREGQTSSHQQGQTENEYQTMNEGRGKDHGEEEHDYHVLEGPGENTHLHQNRELETRQVRGMGGAMDYETPLPLKKM